MRVERGLGLFGGGGIQSEQHRERSFVHSNTAVLRGIFTPRAVPVFRAEILKWRISSLETVQKQADSNQSWVVLVFVGEENVTSAAAVRGTSYSLDGG